MSDKFQMLAELGAGEFQHLDGSLIEHLNGTRDLLHKWGAATELQDAGLYHAAYGTAGYGQNLVSIDHRSKIASIIGAAAEEIVYQYCACDRKTFFPRIGQNKNPDFPNRFSGEIYQLPDDMLRDFCELTAANEIEIAIDNPVFLNQYGEQLAFLFASMSPYLSLSAQKKANEVFGSNNA